MGGIIIVVAIVGIPIGLYFYRKSKFTQNNWIIQRPAGFQKLESIFSSEKVSSVSGIISNINREALQYAKVEILNTGQSSVTFKHRSDWTATLIKIESKGDYFRYKFRVNHLVTHRGGISNWAGLLTLNETRITDLNVCLTVVEQAFLKADLDTLVQRQETDWNDQGKWTKAGNAEVNQKILAQNVRDLTPKTRLADDHGLMAIETVIQPQSIQEEKILLDLPTQAEWIEYFELVNDRKPTADEYVAAKNKEFLAN